MFRPFHVRGGGGKSVFGGVAGGGWLVGIVSRFGWNVVRYNE